MALGFCLGPVLLMAPAARRRTFIMLGLAMTGAFIVLRVLNMYGDPSPRASQSSWTLTMLSFLRTTKYPPSLQFLLMTLGPSLLVLAWFDNIRAWWYSALVVIGRVPFFFYVAHWWILHPLVVVLAYWRYGAAAGNFIFGPVPALSADPKAYPGRVRLLALGGLSLLDWRGAGDVSAVQMVQRAESATKELVAQLPLNFRPDLFLMCLLQQQ